MINKIEPVALPQVDEQIREEFELEVPKSGTQIVFSEGKFKKFFSTQAFTRGAEIAAAVTQSGLGGFRIQLFESVPKHRSADGSLVYYDPDKPVAGKALVRLNGE